MMNTYAFELGRKKDLCRAELMAVLGKENLVEESLDTSIYRLPDQDFHKLQNKLGGTIKIVKILHTVPISKIQALDCKKIIEKHLVDTFREQTGKIPFSLSLLGFMNQKEMNIKDLLNFCKQVLKSLGLNSRFVNKNFQNTKPSTIFKARVIEKGADLNIIKGLKCLFIGESVSMQNIDAYSKRDFHKPGRDAKVGMLPPKLAQTMINLAGPRTTTIFDPFCGTGTIPMEGLLMDKDVVGSDIEERMVAFCDQNLTWTKENFKTTHNSRTFIKDARFITKGNLPEKVDAIVTEGYLGPAVNRLPSIADREKVFRELANLHLNWLKAVHPLTSPSCKIVMCVAAYKDGNKIEHLPKFNELAREAGYRVTAAYTYDRPEQVVARDVKILEKLNSGVRSETSEFPRKFASKHAAPKSWGKQSTLAKFAKKPWVKDKPFGEKPFGPKKPWTKDKPLGDKPLGSKPYTPKPFPRKPGEKPYVPKPYRHKSESPATSGPKKAWVKRGTPGKFATSPFPKSGTPKPFSRKPSSPKPFSGKKPRK